MNKVYIFYKAAHKTYFPLCLHTCKFDATYHKSNDLVSCLNDKRLDIYLFNLMSCKSSFTASRLQKTELIVIYACTEMIEKIFLMLFPKIYSYFNLFEFSAEYERMNFYVKLKL